MRPTHVQLVYVLKAIPFAPADDQYPGIDSLASFIWSHNYQTRADDR